MIQINNPTALSYSNLKGKRFH